MSENYRALTRKYRPQSFEEIVSQEHVSSTLKNAIQQNRLSHAYMFSGPRGVGKTTMARVLAREVNEIANNVDGEALNQTLNVIEIDAASNNSVEDIRDLRERVRVPPQSGKYKIYIIDEVHMLSKSAFNAFLKTLEEPPDHVIFIFATTEPNKVLPTILSRVQRFDFRRLKVEEIVTHLRKISEQESIEIDDDSLHVIAKKADGALRDALGLMDQAISFCGSTVEHEELLKALNVVSADRLFELTEAVRTHDADRGLTIINDALQEGYDIQEFLTELLDHLRNLYVAKNSEQMYLVEVSDNMKKQYRKTSEAFTRDDLMRMLHIVSEAQRNAKEAQQPRIQFEIAILKLVHMQRSQTLQHLISGLEELKKNFDSSEQSVTRQKDTGTAGHSSQPNGSDSADSPQADPSLQEKAEASPESGNGVTSTHNPPDNTEAGGDARAEGPQQEVEEEVNTDQIASSEIDPSSLEIEESAEESTENNPFRHRDFFGQSSLNKYQSNIETKQADNAEETNRRQADGKQKKPSSFSVADLKESWAKFVEQLEDEVQQMLHIQLERMEPIDLNNRTITLQCENPFAKKLIQEHRKKITRSFSKFVGAGFQIEAKVVSSKQEKQQSQSPYERFKKLQQKDPTIKTIVELFGAELEY